MQDIGRIGDETWMLNNLTQTTSKTLKRTAPSHEIAVAPPKKARRIELNKTKLPQLTQFHAAQVFLEADLQKMLGNTDLFQCFKSWVHKQGAVYKVMTRDIITSTKVALELRSNLKTDQTCWVSVQRLSRTNLELVYLRLCKMKETDDRGYRSLCFFLFLIKYGSANRNQVQTRVESLICIAYSTSPLFSLRQALIWARLRVPNSPTPFFYFDIFYYLSSYLLTNE